MKRVVKISIILLLCLNLTGCRQSAPTAESVEEKFFENYDDIQMVVDFMLNTGYGDVYIDSADGTMFADLETMTISDETVNNSVERLIRGQPGSEGQYYGFYKISHTIEILQWKYMEVGCGIAYTTSETLLPKIQYCTELVPLAEAGWYYYVADYNEWRVGKRPQLSTSTTAQ